MGQQEGQAPGGIRGELRVYPPIARATLVMARCQKTRRPFGIRFEERVARTNKWEAVWTFATQEEVAKRDGYLNKNSIAGEILLGDEYPGCPYCQASDFVRCNNCAKVGCWVDGTSMFTCPSCGKAGPVIGSIKSLSTGRE